MHRPMLTTRSSFHSSVKAGGGRRTGFTLVELLVTIGIIGLLVSIVLAVGVAVAGTGKQRATEQVLRSLDLVLESYVAETGGIPGPTEPFPDGGDPTNPLQTVVQPVADARLGTTDEMINSVGWFMLQCRNSPSAEAKLKGLDSRFVKEWDATVGTPSVPALDQPRIATVFDAWGNAIRYVHPAFDGLIHGPDYSGGNVTPGGAASAVRTEDVIGPPPQNRVYGFTSIRRNNRKVGTQATGDSDGGMCQSETPYFYSAGPDGDPATVEDNVYTTRPIFPVN